MPEVSRFYGIIIRFYYRDHPPTHFHAIYGEFEAQIEIESGAIHRGRLPKTAYDLVNRWSKSMPNEVTSAGGVGHVLFAHLDHWPAAAELLRSA